MEKKTVLRGKYDYASTNGILALHWKDNKNVTLLSTDAGIEPLKNVQRFDKAAKKKVNVPCPYVIKQYNGKIINSFRDYKDFTLVFQGLIHDLISSLFILACMTLTYISVPFNMHHPDLLMQELSPSRMYRDLTKLPRRR